jgi:hypothetical protein
MHWLLLILAPVVLAAVIIYFYDRMPDDWSNGAS